MTRGWKNVQEKELKLNSKERKRNGQKKVKKLVAVVVEWISCNLHLRKFEFSTSTGLRYLTVGEDNKAGENGHNHLGIASTDMFR